MRDLKIEISKKDKILLDCQIELDLAKEEVCSNGIKFSQVQKERDLLKLKNEKIMKILRENDLIPEEEGKDKELEETKEIKLIEEYHEKLESFKIENS